MSQLPPQHTFVLNKLNTSTAVVPQVLLLICRFTLAAGFGTISLMLTKASANS
jgi:hypothetical protein